MLLVGLMLFVLASLARLVVAEALLLLHDFETDLSCTLLLLGVRLLAAVWHWGTGELPVLCCSTAVRPVADAVRLLVLSQFPAVVDIALRLLTWLKLSPACSRPGHANTASACDMLFAASWSSARPLSLLRHCGTVVSEQPAKLSAVMPGGSCLSCSSVSCGLSEASRLRRCCRLASPAQAKGNGCRYSFCY
jgi:hypothetical protein